MSDSAVINAVTAWIAVHRWLDAAGIVLLAIFCVWRACRPPWRSIQKATDRAEAAQARFDARNAEVVRLAQNDGRWDDPKRRGEAVKAAERRQCELDARDRNRRAR